MLKSKDRIDLLIRAASNTMATAPGCVKILEDLLKSKQQAFNVLKILTLLNKMVFDFSIDYDLVL